LYLKFKYVAQHFELIIQILILTVPFFISVGIPFSLVSISRSFRWPWLS